MWDDDPQVRQCVEALNASGVIAYPTEGVWGLGCDPFDEAATQKILDLKQRPREKGLILIAGSTAQVAFLLEGLTEDLRQKLDVSWPGHTTWLIPHQNRIPEWVTGVHDTVAVRVTRHPVVQALCNGFGGPIISTSANPAGLPSATEPAKVRCYFGENQLHYAPGQVGSAASASKIIHLLTDDIIR